MAQTPTVTRTGKGPDPVAVLILQWLTYSLWGGYVASLTFLAGIVFAVAFGTAASPVPGDLLAFALAAALVLLGLALLVDKWYSRWEPAEKLGAAKIIMLIHAVLFTLASAVLAVVVVYNLMATLVGAEGMQGGRTAVVLTMVTGLFGLGVLLARVLAVFRYPWVRRVVALVMIAIGGGFVIAAFAGPVVEARLVAADAVVEDGAQVLAMEVNSYASKHDKLPSVLSELVLDANQHGGVTSSRYDNAKKALSENLVRYTPNTKPSTTTTGYKDGILYSDDKSVSSSPVMAPNPGDGTEVNVFYYRMCVTYKAAGANNRGYIEPAIAYDTGMAVVPDTYTHDKGEKCYDLQTRYTY